MAHVSHDRIENAQILAVGRGQRGDRMVIDMRCVEPARKARIVGHRGAPLRKTPTRTLRSEGQRLTLFCAGWANNRRSSVFSAFSVISTGMSRRGREPRALRCRALLRDLWFESHSLQR